MTRHMPLFVLALTVMGTAWTADPAVGVWTLNIDKSTYLPGPPPRSQTRTYKEDADGIRVTIRTIDAAGKSLTIEYPANYDGKEYRVTGSPDTDGIVMKKVDARTAESKLMHAGREIGTARRVVSPDGKTLTITYQGVTPNGDTVKNLGVYTRK